MKKIVALLLVFLLCPNMAYAFEQISWDKREIIPKAVPSEPITDRLWLGGRFVRFVEDEEAIPADYGYTAASVQTLYDVEVSVDGFDFEKINKKVPYGNGHKLYEIGEYFKIKLYYYVPPGKEWTRGNLPEYVYDRDWNLVASAENGEKLEFDFNLQDADPIDSTSPFYEHSIIREANGWFYCRGANMTLDGYTYYPVIFQQKELKRTSGGLSGTKYKQLAWALNNTHDKDIISYDNIYWYEMPMYCNYESMWEYDGYMYIENVDSYYKMKLEPPNNPYVILDGELLAFEEIPVRENDSLLVPMRFLFEQMGAEVDWNQQTKTATAALADHAVTFSIDSLNATVNEAPQKMDVPARLVNDTTMIPLRFLSENLGYTVTWVQEAQTAFIEN